MFRGCFRLRPRPLAGGALLVGLLAAVSVVKASVPVPGTLGVPEGTLGVPEGTLGVPEGTLGVPEDTALDSQLEATEWLLGYLRIDTTNPPGNEAQAAAYLARILHREGIATQTFVTPAGRANLYARLEADEVGAESVVLLHHMDVVAAGDGWIQPPFGAQVGRGRVWGRGAIDAKSLGIAHLAAFIQTKRSGRPLKKDLVFIAAADEESGGQEGVGWLLKNHPELFKNVAGVLNEGGSNRVIGEATTWWGVEVAQKRPLWLSVSTRGRGGHGSAHNPGSAVHQLLNGLTNLLTRTQDYRVTEASRLYFSALAPYHGEAFQQVFNHPDVETVQARFNGMMAKDRGASVLLPGMTAYFQDTVQITSIETPTTTINVVPESATALIDIRLLPDTPVQQVVADIRRELGSAASIEILLQSPPIEPSSLKTPVYRAILTAVGGDAPIIPSFITGTTDSRYLRALGIPAYGFSPFELSGSEARGIHGPNESIPLKKFQRGVQTMEKVVRAAVLN